MADDVKRLAKFTPTAADRDALLYAAGRASAPRRRPWQAACVGLLLLQVATLAWLASPVTPAAVVEPVPTPAVVPDDPRPWQPPDPSSYLALLNQVDNPLPPLPSGTYAPPGKPLTVRSSLE